MLALKSRLAARSRIALMFVAAGAAVPPPAAAQEAFLGEIRLVGFSYCPQDWVEAAGQVLQIQSNNALFALLGTTYGGDGQKTFALPDLGAQVPVKGARYCIAMNGVFPSRP
jgi:microcystin-dependent protein